MTRKIQPRINLSKHNPSADVSGATLSNTAVKTAAPTQEKITLQKVPKTTKTPLQQLMNKMSGKMGRLALVNRPRMKTQRTEVIFRSPRMR